MTEYELERYLRALDHFKQSPISSTKVDKQTLIDLGLDLDTKRINVHDK